MWSAVSSTAKLGAAAMDDIIADANNSRCVSTSEAFTVTLKGGEPALVFPAGP